MHLGLFNREQLTGDDPRLIGKSTADQFQRTHGALEAWSEAEHHDDGTHGDITADTLRVEGAVDLAGDVTIDGLLTINPDLGIQSGHVRFGQQPPIDPTAPNPATDSLLVGGHLVPTGQTFDDVPILNQPFDLGNDIGRWRDLSVWRYLREYRGARSLPLGYWTNNKSFNMSAANFYADAGATWTYTPTPTTCQWEHHGETTIVSLTITSSTVGGTPPARLYMNLPNAAVSAGNFGTLTRTMYALMHVTGPYTGICLAEMLVGQPGRVAFLRDLLGTPWPAGAMHLVGQFACCTTGDN